MKSWKTKEIERRQRILESKTEQNMRAMCTCVRDAKQELICELETMNRKILALEDSMKQMQTEIENYSNTVQNGTNRISDEIKEIKTAIQVLAVNELLDEIDISESKS